MTKARFVNMQHINLKICMTFQNDTTKWSNKKYYKEKTLNCHDSAAAGCAVWYWQNARVSLIGNGFPFSEEKLDGSETKQKVTPY